MNIKTNMQLLIYIFIFIVLIFIDYDNSYTQNHGSVDFQPKVINIRNTNGKFYAYIVLLFNENPHFVNIIQEDSISLKMMQKEGFHVIEYKNYLRTIKEPKLKKLSELMYSIYSNPEKYTENNFSNIESVLSKRNIILRFSKDNGNKNQRIVLDYCIYGKRKPLNILHPLFNIKKLIYNIQPLIYYDEFSTSNSTFYFDMIYINPEEVQNDYIIAKKVLKNSSVESMFFVGARVSDNIKFCLKKAFSSSKSIKREIWKMFEIHELTHKILNNHYNFFDQVTGEELALVSTIYANPYLGLSVLYSYLDYNVINPHRIAAMNFIRFAANRTSNLEIIDNPNLLSNLTEAVLKKLSKYHFNSVLRSMK